MKTLSGYLEAVSRKFLTLNHTTKGKMNMRNKTVKSMATAAMVAALYFALSLPFLALNFGAVQLRVSEALTLLPVFSTNPVVGLTLGCVLVNTLGAVTGANILGPLDIIFGSAATLLAGFLSYRLRDIRWKDLPLLSALAPVLINGIVVGLELTLVISGGFNLNIFLINFAQVAFGEAIACYVLGLPLVHALERTGVSQKIFTPLSAGKASL